LAVGVGAASEEPSKVVLRYIDVVLVAVAAIPALALGAPPVGYAIGASVWILQRIIAITDRRWIGRLAEPRKQLGFNLFEAFGRIWLLAGGIVAAGLVRRADGLTAALVILGAYSVALLIRLASGPPQGRPSR
jgi:hypothetical protein